MNRFRYVVVLHEGQWMVKSNREFYGPYKTKDNAIRAAIEAAQADLETHHPAEQFD